MLTKQAGKSVKALKFLNVKNTDLKSFQSYILSLLSANMQEAFCQIHKKRNFGTLSDHCNTWFSKNIHSLFHSFTILTESFFAQRRVSPAGCPSEIRTGPLSYASPHSARLNLLGYVTTLRASPYHTELRHTPRHNPLSYATPHRATLHFFIIVYLFDGKLLSVSSNSTVSQYVLTTCSRILSMRWLPTYRLS